MSQIVTETLYRKYRPMSFSDVIGQSEVVETLQKQIKSGSIAHAYLFSGGRGTGKTSIARIFARELGTDDADLYEIDAASNRGINEIRELRDGVSNLPFNSPYKVYIIDEVHMLTKEAFNALLKTLEEPPSHVIFILATTEKHKVLDTILSRCQVYDFRLAIMDSLVELVKQVAKKEKRIMDEGSISYVATLGNGSFRDTLSHLQKVFAICEDPIAIENLQKLIKEADHQITRQLLVAISGHNKEKLFETYQKIIDEKYSVITLLDDLLKTTRHILLHRNSIVYKNNPDNFIVLDPDNLLSEYSGVTSHTLRDLLQTKSLVSLSQKPEESFEIFLHELVENWND